MAVLVCISCYNPWNRARAPKHRYHKCDLSVAPATRRRRREPSSRTHCSVFVPKALLLRTQATFYHALYCRTVSAMGHGSSGWRARCSCRASPAPAGSYLTPPPPDDGKLRQSRR